MEKRSKPAHFKVISLLRDEIKLDDTFAKSAIINGDHKVGYIYLPEFYIDFANPNGAKCSEDVAKEIKKLKELLDLGAISQEEYDKKKKQLLNL